VWRENLDVDYSFLRAIVAKCHKLGGLKMTEMYLLPVLEARSPKSP
jgi:hypothetical protein